MPGRLIGDPAPSHANGGDRVRLPATPDRRECPPSAGLIAERSPMTPPNGRYRHVSSAFPLLPIRFGTAPRLWVGTMQTSARATRSFGGAVRRGLNMNAFMRGRRCTELCGEVGAHLSGGANSCTSPRGSTPSLADAPRTGAPMVASIFGTCLRQLHSYGEPVGVERARGSPRL